VAKESAAAAGEAPVTAVGFSQFSAVALAKLRFAAKGLGRKNVDKTYQQQVGSINSSR
jgi:hypothetical protein